MDNITGAIKGLGLSEKQETVYKILLETGGGTAHQLSKKSGLKRTTAYNILSELQKLGLIFTVPGKNTWYRPLSPANLIKRRNQRLQKVAAALPEIEAMLSKSGVREKPTVKYFEGTQGIQELYDYRLEEMRDQTIYAFYSVLPKNVKEIFSNFGEWNKSRQKYKTNIKAIAPDVSSGFKKEKSVDKRENRQIRVLPLEKFSGKTTIKIGNDWVKINDYDNLHGLIIENPVFAKTMRDIFEVVWEVAQDKD